MKAFLVLLAAVSVASGLKYTGLRAKFGWSDALADTDYFFKIPRTINEAESSGWKRIERPPGPLPELRMYCPPGRAVCPLFDTAGFVAGLQIALPVDDYESLAIKPEKKFVKWNAPAVEGEPAKQYWTLTQFYVSQDSLKAGSGPQVENGETLQDGGVWVTGLDGKLLKIPISEAELNTTAYKRQNCVPNMGTHYYYNMTEQMKCEDLLPWFALTTNGELLGTGFMMFGKLATQKPRHWFEIPPSRSEVAEITIPYAPKCLEEWGTSYGILSLHIYYIDDPWNIRCKNGDSVKPAPVMGRLMLNGYRYANQVADEVKRLFSG
ncbi:uncharacterized protein LOC114364499 isoform X3 [Ostrinia furnacalis]|uniref:uncharacterized protein LOC114364499 isoform X3 n=2 Tax=Ostrinia furnacalis TaxID=93504 RepID=UPI00103A4653|nr:uncharacterized protein LOC114364499 isoform X3 [Ostrinia furnacalis]